MNSAKHLTENFTLLGFHEGRDGKKFWTDTKHNW